MPVFEKASEPERVVFGEEHDFALDVGADVHPGFVLMRTVDRELDVAVGDSERRVRLEGVRGACDPSPAMLTSTEAGLSSTLVTRKVPPSWLESVKDRSIGSAFWNRCRRMQSPDGTSSSADNARPFTTTYASLPCFGMDLESAAEAADRVADIDIDRRFGAAFRRHGQEPAGMTLSFAPCALSCTDSARSPALCTRMRHCGAAERIRLAEQAAIDGDRRGSRRRSRQRASSGKRSSRNPSSEGRPVYGDFLKEKPGRSRAFLIHADKTLPAKGSRD